MFSLETDPIWSDSFSPEVLAANPPASLRSLNRERSGWWRGAGRPKRRIRKVSLKLWLWQLCLADLKGLNWSAQITTNPTDRRSRMWSSERPWSFSGLSTAWVFSRLKWRSEWSTTHTVTAVASFVLFAYICAWSFLVVICRQTRSAPECCHHFSPLLFFIYFFCSFIYIFEKLYALFSASRSWSLIRSPIARPCHGWNETNAVKIRSDISQWAIFTACALQPVESANCMYCVHQINRENTCAGKELILFCTIVCIIFISWLHIYTGPYWSSIVCYFATTVSSPTMDVKVCRSNK